MAASHRRRSTCRLCGSPALAQVVSFVPTPPANQFVTAAELDRPQPCFPLDLYLCEVCGHVQLRDVVDPKLLFEHYVYVSGTSARFVEHFEAYAGDVAARFALGPDALVVDIGSNDGTLLEFFRRRGTRILGVDPAREIAAGASARGIETIPEFFTPELATRIRRDHGAASVVTANNVFAHGDDLAGILDGVRLLLAEGGGFVFEVSYLVDVVEQTLFDTVYHEHLAYHSVQPLRRFFSGAGFELFDVVRVPSHGGSIRGFAQRAGGPRKTGDSVGELVALERALGLDRADTFRAWAARIAGLKQELRALLGRLRGEQRSIAGFGAPAKATTLMYQLGIGPDVIDYIVDESPLKQGLYTPGLHIPVVAPAVLGERPPDCLLILAWNFADSIIDRYRAFSDRGGAFIVPLPELRLITG